MTESELAHRGGCAGAEPPPTTTTHSSHLSRQTHRTLTAVSSPHPGAGKESELIQHMFTECLLCAERREGKAFLVPSLSQLTVRREIRY